MESPSTSEVPHASTGNVPAFFFSSFPSTPGSLQSLVSGVLQRGQAARSDTFEAPTASSPTSFSFRTHRMPRTSRPSPAGPSRAPTRAARMISSRSVARASVSAEDSSEVDGSRSGPNTRSRKRRASEPKTPAASAAPPPRKRTRAKPASNLKKPPPGPKTENNEDGDQKLPPIETASCCICMCDPEAEDLAMVNGCEHRFCFECIEKWSERENTCPLCKTRFVKIDRVNRQKRKKGSKNTKKVKQRDQRSDLVPGAALEGLLANFASRHPFPPQSIARLIFSGVGNGFFEISGGGHAPPSLRGRAVARAVNARGDSLANASAEGDDEENGFTGLFRAVHGRSMVMGSGLSVGVRPISFSTSHVAASRSYATNVNDRTAGIGAENPLEIEDDSDEEEVEVVQVMRPS